VEESILNIKSTLRRACPRDVSETSLKVSLPNFSESAEFVKIKSKARFKSISWEAPAEDYPPSSKCLG